MPPFCYDSWLDICEFFERKMLARLEICCAFFRKLVATHFIQYPLHFIEHFSLDAYTDDLWKFKLEKIFRWDSESLSFAHLKRMPIQRYVRFRNVKFNIGRFNVRRIIVEKSGVLQSLKSAFQGCTLVLHINFITCPTRQHLSHFVRTYLAQFVSECSKIRIFGPMLPRLVTNALEDDYTCLLKCGSIALFRPVWSHAKIDMGVLDVSLLSELLLNVDDVELRFYYDDDGHCANYEKQWQRHISLLAALNGANIPAIEGSRDPHSRLAMPVSLDEIVHWLLYNNAQQVEAQIGANSYDNRRMRRLCLHECFGSYAWQTGETWSIINELIDRLKKEFVSRTCQIGAYKLEIVYTLDDEWSFENFEIENACTGERLNLTTTQISPYSSSYNMLSLICSH